MVMLHFFLLALTLSAFKLGCSSTPIWNCCPGSGDPVVCDWQNGVARSGAGSEAAVGAEGKSWESLCAGWWDLGALEREGAELGGVQGLMDMVLRLLLHCCPVLNVGLTSAFFE